MKYNNWTVLREYPDEKSGRLRFDLVCDCGKESTTLASYVISGASKWCRSCALTVGKESYRESGTLPSARRVYSQYKFRAKDRDLSFDLTLEDVLRLNQMPCHYCDLPPSNVCKAIKSYHEDYVYSGIDRVDNSVGYNLDNVVPCCVVCNLGKRSLGVEEFYAWVERLTIKARKT